MVQIQGKVSDLIFVGSTTRFRFKGNDDTTLISTNPDGDLAVGDEVTAQWSKEKEFLVQ